MPAGEHALIYTVTHLSEETARNKAHFPSFSREVRYLNLAIWMTLSKQQAMTPTHSQLTLAKS